MKPLLLRFTTMPSPEFPDDPERGLSVLVGLADADEDEPSHGIRCADPINPQWAVFSVRAGIAMSVHPDREAALGAVVEELLDHALEGG